MEEKTLIVYYSRTESSKAVAKLLQEKLGCDINEITYANKNKKINSAIAAFEAVSKSTTNIAGDRSNAKDYQHIIFISPVWASALATPIRSYIAKNKSVIKSYDMIAVSAGGSGIDGCVNDAIAVIGKPPKKTAMYNKSQIAEKTLDLEY